MGLKLADEVSPVFKVLLIDDDINQHNIIGVALRNDFSLICEISGALAVQVALKEKPDLILLDLQMPHVDGFEVLEQIKRNPSLSNIPIFCLSATTEDEKRERSTRLGASSFITKPINIKTLAKDIKNTLENLNSALASEDGRTSVFVGMNETEMKRWYQNKISEVFSKGQKVLTLSVREGAFFLNEELGAYLLNEQIIYLQIKPSFLSRLPFLNDLSTITADLAELLDEPTDKYTLMIDRPELFLLSPAIDNKTAAILAFSDALKNKFYEINYLCRKPTSAFEFPAMNEMARLLAQKY